MMDSGIDWLTEGNMPPVAVLTMLKEHGNNGIVVSGLISWVVVNQNENALNIWNSVALQHWNSEEVISAKKALMEAMAEDMLKVLPNMKINRAGNNKAEKDLKDIVEAIKVLSENRRMPLVLATAGQMQGSPKSLGSIDPEAKVSDQGLSSGVMSCEVHGDK